METFDYIRKFLKQGGRCLIIEEGRPYVVLAAEEYERLTGQEAAEPSLEHINKTIEAWKAKEAEAGPTPLELAEEEPRLEDLPL
ncbi:hypothetical protein HYW30_00405 [Candidatus Azambacteria bacterium]|nr:hypothetical protein [Candidatus Azambacteria bacterium]MBI2587752.1 hypothetical protein [Candidatus Azambacteria bacterium]